VHKVPPRRDAATGVAPGRCGYGPRLPLLVISPYARRNFVDHTLTDQTSIARFIEDNWGLPRLGDGAMDQWAGSLVAMFNFGTPARTDLLILDPETGIRAKRVYLPSSAWHARNVGRRYRRADHNEP
jgi:phospholipase C